MLAPIARPTMIAITANTKIEKPIDRRRTCYPRKTKTDRQQHLLRDELTVRRDLRSYRSPVKPPACIVYILPHGRSIAQGRARLSYGNDDVSAPPARYLIEAERARYRHALHDMVIPVGVIALGAFPRPRFDHFLGRLPGLRQFLTSVTSGGGWVPRTLCSERLQHHRH